MYHVGTLRSTIDKQKVELKALQNSLALTKVVIDTQNQSISKITKAREADSTAFSDLIQFHNGIVRTYSKRLNSRQTLESKNVEIKNYVDGDVPLELRRLFDAQNARYISSSPNKD